MDRILNVLRKILVAFFKRVAMEVVQGIVTGIVTGVGKALADVIAGMNRGEPGPDPAQA